MLRNAWLAKVAIMFDNYGRQVPVGIDLTIN